MKATKRLDILVIVVAALSLMNCSKNELLTSFEEEQEQSFLSIPLQFTPYVGSGTEATTRADLNYLSNIHATDNSNRLNVFREFPWYSPNPDNPNNPDEGTGSAAGSRGNNYGKNNYRFGKLGNNSYIVGVYGYYGLNNDVPMTWKTMTNNTNLSSLTSNFMTNQPLLHTASGNNWNYTPLRYWPNSTSNTDVKVTFVSYYPFQDYPESGRGYNSTTRVTGYYRDGKNADGVEDDRYVDFSDCIVPPAKDAKGADAYTFTFTQKEKLEEQIDFLLGINPDVTKQNVSDFTPNINLKLKHTLCAVAFDLRAPAFSLPANTEVRFDINSIRFEGLYGKGKVYPVVDVVDNDKFDIQWKDLEMGDTSYILKFDDADNFCGVFERPYFDGKKQRRYRRQQIYENSNYKAENLDPDYITAAGNDQANSRGMKYLMMVIPQKVEVSSDGVTPKKAYLVVNYDITYKYSGGVTNIFKDNEEWIQLKDDEKQDNKYKNKRQMFLAGTFLTFNIRFLGPKQIEMDAVVSDWEDTEEYDLPTDDYNDSGEGQGENP